MTVKVVDMTAMFTGKGRVPTETLATRLMLMRHELDVSQREASDATGVPFGTWQGMEMGRQTRKLDEHIRKIAEHYGYDAMWLMWGIRPSEDGGGQPSPPSEVRGRRPAASSMDTKVYPYAA